MPTSDDSLNWPDAARALRERIPDCVEPAVRRKLRAATERKVLVACSGGADSVALLCLLWTCFRELKLSLLVAHYNHRWRGAESDADAVFVASLAAGLDLPFRTGARPEGEAALTETAARELRLGFLRQVAREDGCGFIALGHQGDDILETQLLRLVRGAGAEGLAAPRPVHDFGGLPTHLRPILHLRAGDIRMALNACGLPWREDRTNEDTAIARNALRREVIPSLAAATGRNPNAGAARSRRLLDEDAAALDLLARERLPGAYSGQAGLSRAELRAQPVALSRRALSHWLHNDRGIQTVSAAFLDELLDAVYGRRLRHRFSLAGGFVRIDGEIICRESAPERVAESLVESRIKPGETILLSTGAELDSEWVELDSALLVDILAGEVDPAEEVFIALAESAPLRVRPRRAGDRFRPLGAPGSRKLQDCLTDAGIPARERDRLPVVTSSAGAILWVPGLPPAESVRLHPASKLALRLTYLPGKPPSP